MLFVKEHIFRKFTMEKESKNLLAIILIFVLAVAIGVVLVGCVDKDTEATIISVGSGVIAIVGLILFYQRLKKQEEQIDLQRKQRTDDRFTTAVELLGSSEASARTGAIYSLYHLAIEDKKYRKEVAQILCSHIRSKTNEPDYKEEHKERASNEIQTTIDLLLKDKDGNKGLYCQDFAKEINFPKVNFEYAYLVKADFAEAHCQGANFRFAQCQGADFAEAQCQGANFNKAQCQGADFYNAQCQGANFIRAQCQKADFTEAQCQKADFTEAQCQGAYFRSAQCQGAYFRSAQCQGVDFSLARWQEANFSAAECQGAVFALAQCQGADFNHAQCQGADFNHAQCQGADFNHAQCQGAEFRSTQCQGACFSDAQCQGAYFFDAQCQGAYVGNGYIEFKNLIGKKTELQTMQFAGELTKEVIEKIEAAKNYLDDEWYQKMQEIIEENKGKEAEYTIPEGIITGELEDNEENRAIAEKNWEKLKQIQKKLQK